MTSTGASTRTSDTTTPSVVARPRFELLSLLVFVTASAALAAAYRLIETSPWLPEPPSDSEKLAAICFAALCLSGLLCGLLQSARQQSRFVFSVSGSVTLLIVHLFSALSCWHVLGDLAPAAHWLVTCFALVPSAFCAFGSFRDSIAAAFIGAVLTVPVWGTQLVLVARLNVLRTEILSIAEYAESVKRSTGVYPSDLAQYQFGHSSLAERITYVAPGDWWKSESRPGDYLIAFKLYDDDNTCREYTPGNGWYYYPD